MTFTICITMMALKHANALLTIVAAIVIGAVLRSVLEWAVGGARWGANR